jgi:2-dehydropantoate 2-reductase
MDHNFNIVIYGSGAIGATLGGWLFQNGHNVYLLARGENAKAIKANGLILYERDPENSETILINVIEDLKELNKVDLIILAVKNYDLDTAADDIYKKLDDQAMILTLQNGVKNITVLPSYFSKIVYGVIVMSAWRDKPGIFGNRGKNQIVIGTPNNQNQELMRKIFTKLNPSFPIEITSRYMDAAYSKLVLNIANSIFTLIKQNTEDDEYIYKLLKIFAITYLEAVKIVKAAGYKEYKLKGLPSWRTIKILKKLGKRIALKSFKKNLRFSWLNSMSQDKILRQKDKTELETLNGHLLELAHQYGLKVPFNEVIYRLCKETFSNVPYKPLHVDFVWREIERKLAESK